MFWFLCGNWGLFLCFVVLRFYNDGFLFCVELWCFLLVGMIMFVIDVSFMLFSVFIYFSNLFCCFVCCLVFDVVLEVVVLLLMLESLVGELWFLVGWVVDVFGGEWVDGWILEEWCGLVLCVCFSVCWCDLCGNFWNVLL